MQGARTPAERADFRISGAATEFTGPIGTKTSASKEYSSERSPVKVPHPSSDGKATGPPMTRRPGYDNRIVAVRSCGVPAVHSLPGISDRAANDVSLNPFVVTSTRSS